LLDEIKELRAIASSEQSNESVVQKTDYTLGIYQSIGELCQSFPPTPTYNILGYKEFHDYLASTVPSEKLFASAVEQMKNGTRQYARRQIRWLRNKLLPAAYNTDSEGDHAAALVPVYLLDATGKLAQICISDFRQCDLYLQNLATGGHLAYSTQVKVSPKVYHLYFLRASINDGYWQLFSTIRIYLTL
jgi:hypothetical protein